MKVVNCCKATALAAIILAIAVCTCAQSPASTSQPGKGFVTRSGRQLQLDGKPFYFAGANFYPAMVNAAAGGDNREQVTKVFQTMQDLGLTVLRTWAYNDATDTQKWQALQTQPGVFDETVFRDGLDWIVSEAPKYDVKLMLTLTNYQADYGGAPQYARWNNAPNVNSFYTDSTMIGQYRKYVETIINRKNSITGVVYKEDPNIFAWDLINEPHAIGDDSGDMITTWLGQVSKYVKSLDPNHLVGVGTEGYFGKSTPEKLRYNPSYLPYWDIVANGGRAAPYAGVCEGQDFNKNHDLDGIDFTSSHIYPDYWVPGDIDGQIAFVKNFLDAQTSISEGLGKPLIITEFGKLGPFTERNTFFKYIYDTAAQSASQGGVLAGTMVWTLGTSPSYPSENGYFGFGVYPTEQGYLEKPSDYVQPSKGLPLTASVIQYQGWREMLECNDRYATDPQGRYGLTTATEGWAETIAIIRSNAAAVSGGGGGNSSTSGSSTG